MSRVVVLLLLSTVLGCAQGPTGAGRTPARALTVEEALGASAGRQVTVQGYLLAHPDGSVLLCTGLAGSYPPQCGGPALTVKDLDITSLHGADHASGITWTGKITLHGVVHGTVLSVAAGR